MDLRINDRIVLQPGKFYAIIASPEIILAGLNDNPTFQRYTSVLICGNYSRLVNGFNRVSTNFNIRRAFTAHSLMTILQENFHSIVILEHDASMYDDAGEVKRVIPHAMKDVSRDAIFVLYAPKMDKHFAFLTYSADHIISYENTNDAILPDFRKYSKSKTRNNGLPNSQKTLF
jgi:hypothetical protein